ncbi:hypothetical protein [Mammaliicoccus lentus]|uniref:hypothetical protein n=1 Tax=Mammaliicoccus lentus TaxID=42858 RepID=UPI00374FA9DB
MNLRGRENRRKFLKEYDITAISHLKLLEGQKKDGAGGLLTDRYYCFSYRLKGDKGNDIGTFNCGYHIAEDLLELSNQEKLPLFNPFKTINEVNKSHKHEGDENLGAGQSRKQYNDLALQLTNAINLIIFCYDGSINGTLAKIKNETDKYYYNEPYDYKIKSVNTIIGNLFNQKLKDKVNEITKNQEVKNFNFSLLTEVIEKNELVNNFE